MTNRTGSGGSQKGGTSNLGGDVQMDEVRLLEPIEPMPTMTDANAIWSKLRISTRLASVSKTADEATVKPAGVRTGRVSCRRQQEEILPNRSVIFACIVVLGSLELRWLHLWMAGHRLYWRIAMQSRLPILIAWSRKVSSELALRPRSFFPARDSRRAHVAKHAAPKPNEVPQAKIADVRPAAKPAAGPDTTRASMRTHVPSVLLLSVPVQEPRRNRVLAATAVAELLTTATTDPVRYRRRIIRNPTDSEGTGTHVVNNTDLLVGPSHSFAEIKSVSDLTSKTIANG